MVLLGAAALAALLAPAASLQALRDDPTRVSAASFFIQLFSSAPEGELDVQSALGPTGSPGARNYRCAKIFCWVAAGVTGVSRPVPTLANGAAPPSALNRR